MNSFEKDYTYKKNKLFLKKEDLLKNKNVSEWDEVKVNYNANMTKQQLFERMCLNVNIYYILFRKLKK